MLRCTEKKNADYVFKVTGMMCQKNCATTVQNAIASLKSVDRVIVTFSTEEALVWGNNINVNDIISEVEDIGYDITLKSSNSSDDFNGINKETVTLLDTHEEEEKIELEMISTTIISNDNQISISVKKEIMLTIMGMSCANCALRIEKVLKTMNGVVNAIVSVMTNKAKVEINDTIINAVGARDITEKVISMGYTCTVDSINGISTNRSTKNNNNNEVHNELLAWYRPLLVSLGIGIPMIILNISMNVSGDVMMVMQQPCVCDGAVNYMQFIMMILNLTIIIFVGYRYYKAAILGAMHGTYGMDALVVVGTSISFIYSFLLLIFACTSNIQAKRVFFETSGMLLMFVTIGKFIEAYAKQRSFNAVSNLLKLQPRDALLVTQLDSLLCEAIQDCQQLKNHNIYKTSSLSKASSNNTNALNEITKLIDLDLIQKGDILKVFPGDRIPTDGIILIGTSYVDESMITGESVALIKQKGDVVFGSTVNQNNCLYMYVTSLGSESALAQIVQLVENAQMNKAPVQAYADRIAGIFTPCILFLGLLTFLVWITLSLNHMIPSAWFEEDNNDPYLFSMIFAISVIVVSCPCALGLATPTAIMVGTSVGASNGILIKGGSAFETAHKIDTVIFDKTGTLTEGKPSVVDIIVINDIPEHLNHVLFTNNSNDEILYAQDVILKVAATAEQTSDHPISRALLQAAKEKKLILDTLTENATTNHVGSGVICTISFGTIFVGNRLLMKDNHISEPSNLDTIMWGLEIQGKTVICVALNSILIGLIAIADIIKPEAYNCVSALRLLGYDVWMVTGDHRTTAIALAEQLDLPSDRVIAGVLPRHKAIKIEELQALGHYVAMIGDGINDSPALAQANLGIAIGAGTEVAIEAADMVLIRSNLHDLVVALDLAKTVFRRIKLNFIWATFYNIIAVPYAAGIWYPWTKLILPPQYASLAMAASSVSVVLSSMSLWLYKKPAYLNDTRLINIRNKPLLIDTIPKQIDKMINRNNKLPTYHKLHIDDNDMNNIDNEV